MDFYNRVRDPLRRPSLKNLASGAFTAAQAIIFVHSVTTQYTAGVWVNATHDKDTVMLDINGTYVSRSACTK
jgi:hypothetical protein